MSPAEIEVLVVDDVDSVRVQVKDLLTYFGFSNITLAASGLAAMDEVRKKPYHLILCDWHMFPVDGFEFLKFVRSQPPLKNAAFIMVSAENAKEKVIEAIKVGVDDYLIKPLTLTEIETKILNVLKKRGILK